MRARAGLDFDLYHATKHWRHQALREGLSARAIGAQAGWSERDVEAMLDVYGHRELVALAEIDALYAAERDADVMQEDPNAL